LTAQKPWIVTVPGTRNIDHPNENLGALNAELTPDDLGEVDTVLSAIAVPGGGMNAMQMEQVDRSA
jgi:aryl-alcohol dehydrogenase-like predicted oxidoreductase